MRLCLNMIVKDEEAILDRCLKSVLSFISCWAITDTGSSDKTENIVLQQLKFLPGKLTKRPFTNFGESRNCAIDEAKSLDFDYYLFLDADHELVARDLEWHRTLSHDAYLLLQKSGDFSYRNVRLLKKGVKSHYIGATHEWLNVEGEVWAIDEAYIVDHYDGLNRKEKLQRDRDLLERELRHGPNNTRTLFYLAQTHRDLKNYPYASYLYRQRANMDDTEEAWRAQLEYSRCLLELKKDSKFVHNSLITYSRRPDRAEPLYDLSRFFISEKQYPSALPFIEIGMNLPKPEKELGVVDDWIYDHGLRENYSIVAAFNDSIKPLGTKICDELSLDKNASKNIRLNARNNLYYYCDFIGNLVPSWKSKQLTFEPPTGFNQMNCSITRKGDELFLMERTVSYKVDGTGRYSTPENQYSRHFLLKIHNGTLEDETISEVLPPKTFPSPKHNRVTGWEDLRLFEWKGALWVVGCVCEQNALGMAEQYLARIDHEYRLTDWQKLTPIATPARHEKNWMPLSNGELKFVYSCDPIKILDWDANKILVEKQTPISVDHFRGGSQLIPVNGGGYLAIVHSKSEINELSYYYHRFVVFNEDFDLTYISSPFIFKPGDETRRGYQYAMGLCWHPDKERLIVSYQTDESRSWLGTFNARELDNVMRPI